MTGIIIGAGYFARFQAEAWKRLPEVKITAVVDPIAEKAARFAREFGFPRVYSSAREALAAEQPDFADIATRPEAHLELTRIAAARGTHVICQKPMAPSPRECVEMVETCERARVRLLIHENWRWQPWYREAKRQIANGAVGKIFQLSFFWRTGDGRGQAPYPSQPYFKDMPRLLIYETLVHHLDTARFLLGEVESVFCQISRINPVILGEDQALIHLRFANGAYGLIDGNRISGPVPAPVAMGTLILEGDAGQLRVAPDGTLWLAREGQPEERLPFEPPRTGYKGDSVFNTQRHLIESLRLGRASESDGRDYLNTTALVEACYRSAESGRLERPRISPE